MAIQEGHRCQLESSDIEQLLKGEVPPAIQEHVVDARGNEVSFFLPHCLDNQTETRDALARVLYDNMPYARIIPKNGHIAAIAEMDGLLQCPEMIPRALENLHSQTEDDSFFDLPDDEWRDHMQHAGHALGERLKNYGRHSSGEKECTIRAECAEVLVQQLLARIKKETDTFCVMSRESFTPTLPSGYIWHPLSRGNMEVHKDSGRAIAEFDAVAWSPSLEQEHAIEKLYLFDASISRDAIQKKIRLSKREVNFFIEDLTQGGIETHRIHTFVHYSADKNGPEILRKQQTATEHIAMLPSTPAFDRFVERTLSELGQIRPAPERKYMR